MFLNSPIWLLLLAPWLGLTIWLLSGRLETQGVPFLQLWGRETAENRRPNRAWIRPPLALIALLAAILLAILGAARPRIEIPRKIIAPFPETSDVRIEYLGARTAPTTQAMIRLRNQSDLTGATLMLRAGTAAVSEKVDLPAREQTRNYFVDLPSVNSTMDAEVIGDNGKIDHHLQIVQRAAWPIVEARGPLPAALTRMIEVYSRRRPPDEGSKHITVAIDLVDAPTDEPEAILVDPQFASHRLPPDTPTIQDSPLTQSVDWKSILSNAKVGLPPGADWRPVILVGRAVVLAIRENPVRQVWIGFNSDDFPHHPDFVIFWSNIFTWLGDGKGDFQATNAPAPEPKLAFSRPAESAIPLTGPIFISALGLSVLSAAAWKAPRISQRNDSKC